MRNFIYQRGELWRLVVLLLVAVTVPTACVLWFMAEAMRNQEAAVRQKLEDVYRAQMVRARARLEEYWEAKVGVLAEDASDRTPAETFARLVRDGVCDGAIIYDESGQPAYPSPILPAPADESATAEWTEAERLEYEEGDNVAAATAYAKIAGTAETMSIAARALVAQARCLAKAGEKEAAIEILMTDLADAKYGEATDARGRLVVPNGWLLALQLMEDPERPGFAEAAATLAERLRDYDDPVLPASQRRFLMLELRKLSPESASFATLGAEELALEYLEAKVRPEAASYLSPAPPADVWQLASPNRNVVALFREERVVSEMQSLVEGETSVAEASIAVLLPDARQREPDPFIAVPLGQHTPEWRLALYLEGEDPFAAAAKRQTAVYLWTGLLVVSVIMALAVLLARYVGRQMKLTRMKNDLIATVSHELKTPLSSMRVLVDTLLEGRYRDERQVREYLELVSKENVRLSRLIDNFLTFSRMERNKRVFEFSDMRPEEIVNEAAGAVRERVEASGCSFDVEVERGLPEITGDRDALVTVLLNLLDNAYKYSRNDKHVALRAYAADGNVCFEVEDHGIGLSRRAAKKVFDRFYQVDRSLSRSAGGCGLGLSIVEFVVAAHGGSVGVESQPGKGSRFTVKLPFSGALNGE